MAACSTAAQKGTQGSASYTAAAHAAGTLGMACTFMPLPQLSVMEVTSDAATLSGPPICGKITVDQSLV